MNLCSSFLVLVPEFIFIMTISISISVLNKLVIELKPLDLMGFVLVFWSVWLVVCVILDCCFLWMDPCRSHLASIVSAKVENLTE